jgi:methyl-accepting chemotaxis protein
MEDIASDFERSVNGIVRSVATAAAGMTTAQSMTATASARAATVRAASESASNNVGTVAAAAEVLSSSATEISREVPKCLSITRD